MDQLLRFGVTSFESPVNQSNIGFVVSAVWSAEVEQDGQSEAGANTKGLAVPHFLMPTDFDSDPSVCSFIQFEVGPNGVGDP